jgi:hypothetical protein
VVAVDQLLASVLTVLTMLAMQSLRGETTSTDAAGDTSSRSKAGVVTGRARRANALRRGAVADASLLAEEVADVRGHACGDWV